MSGDLRRLADMLGIHSGFHDMQGNWQAISEESMRALAEALGHAADSDSAVAASIARLEEQARQRSAPRDWICVEGETIQLSLAHPVEYRLVDTASGAELRAGDARHALTLPALDSGIYRVEQHQADRVEHTMLLVTPSQLPLRRWLANGDAPWGLMAPLYGLRSRANLGVGDYADFARLASIAGQGGADFLGINPIHALPQSDAPAFSPYSPNHRGFWDVNHLAPDRVPEFAASDEARRLLTEREDEIAALRAAELVDAGRVARLRRPILEALHQALMTAPPGSERRREFESWRRTQGDALRHFATFEALAEAHGPDQRAWPEELRSARATGVARFRQQAADRIRFHEYLQFVAESQIHDVAQEAGNAGMRLGLYFDLAVGTNQWSAEVWAEPEAFVTQASLGAPPDHFNPTGQCWNLAPFHPHALQGLDYEPFARVIRTAMRHAGMIRIDHVLGLNRSYWVPEDGRPGGYVSYPFDALLAIVAIEAARADAVVIGEDLGLVPEGLRPRLEKEGILGCRVMQFERLGQDFRSPADFPRLSITTFGSHDVPTVRGWWRERDVDALVAAALLNEDEAAGMREDRGRVREALWRMLGRYGLLGETPGPMPDDLTPEHALAVHRLLSTSGSLLLGIHLDDVLGLELQQNLPGTVEEHPNWRRRMPGTLEDLADDPSWKATCEAMNRGRGRPQGEQEA
ncbi:MAG: 4-alpha-glucanotransferase [Pseudomonadota bacterium]